MPNRSPLPGERADLLRAGRIIFQKTDGFKFGLDAVLLADFARLCPADAVCDLCAGGGIIPILLSGRAKRIVGVELQGPYVEMGRRSIAANDLSDIELIQGDLREIEALLPASSFEAVTVNPPYLRAGSGAPSEADEINLAKQELTATIGEVARAAKWLLTPGGRLFMVHRPERLCDVFCALRGAGLEPKRVRMVHPAADRPPTLILIEARAGGAPGILFEAPLVVMENGAESAEVREIYAGRAGGEAKSCK
ncbi:MAG TPA: methyltransferase [Terriglobales bacterium]|nr:methyltransferase [Candidatus Acidoferrum sp.]HWQ50336.1 methyltransferase [Terriglobales bacterium]